MTEANIPEDVLILARKQCDLCGITPTSDMRVHAEHVAAFAIMAERKRWMRKQALDDLAALDGELLDEPT